MVAFGCKSSLTFSEEKTTWHLASKNCESIDGRLTTKLPTKTTNMIPLKLYWIGEKCSLIDESLRIRVKNCDD